jgi:hypothetical protein
LIIQNGTTQVRATGGIYGYFDNDQCRCFLRFSIPVSLPDNTEFTCYAPVTPVESIQGHRLFMDYAKVGSNLPAGFISTRFNKIGFKACHPLQYGNYVSNTAAPTFTFIASLIRATVVSHRTNSQNIQDLLQKLLNTEKIKTAINSISRQPIVTSVFQLKQVLYGTGKFGAGIIE